MSLFVPDACLVRRGGLTGVYVLRDGHVWLMPHNPAYEPILGDDAVILGRVTAVIRKV
jgi:hypothetical protein